MYVEAFGGGSAPAWLDASSALAIMIGPVKTVALYVADQQRAEDFYTGVLGFVVRRRASIGPEAAWIEISPRGGQTCLVLYPKSMMPDWGERKPSIVFHCPDVEATVRELEAAGARIGTPPTEQSWGTFAVVLDPDGNELGLTSQRIAPEVD